MLSFQVTFLKFLQFLSKSPPSPIPNSRNPESRIVYFRGYVVQSRCTLVKSQHSSLLCGQPRQPGLLLHLSFLVLVFFDTNSAVPNLPTKNPHILTAETLLNWRIVRLIPSMMVALEGKIGGRTLPKDSGSLPTEVGPQNARIPSSFCGTKF